MGSSNLSEIDVIFPLATIFGTGGKLGKKYELRSKQQVKSLVLSSDDMASKHPLRLLPSTRQYT